MTDRTLDLRTRLRDEIERQKARHGEEDSDSRVYLALAAVERIETLEAAISQWASEGAECGGRGYLDEETNCPQCDDIREYLK